jgi:hypothetical protein
MEVRLNHSNNSHLGIGSEGDMYVYHSTHKLHPNCGEVWGFARAASAWQTYVGPPTRTFCYHSLAASNPNDLRVIGASDAHHCFSARRHRKAFLAVFEARFTFLNSPSSRTADPSRIDCHHHMSILMVNRRRASHAPRSTSSEGLHHLGSANGF